MKTQKTTKTQKTHINTYIENVRRKKRQKPITTSNTYKNPYNQNIYGIENHIKQTHGQRTTNYINNILKHKQYLSNNIWRCLFCYLTQNPTHPYETIGSGEGRFPYEQIICSAVIVIFLMKTQGLIYPPLWVGSLMCFIAYEQNRNCHLDYDLYI